MKYKTKIQPLLWTYLSGKGASKYGKSYLSEDPADFEYKASILVTSDEAKDIQEDINTFWKENKPKKVQKPTSTFLKPEMIDSGKKDTYGAIIKKASGSFLVSASTNTVFVSPAGVVTENKVVILNRLGVKFPDNHPLVLGDVGVADNSKGVIHGEMAITEYEGKAYVKLYLKGVQFVKFVPYEGTNIESEELEGDGDDGSSVEVDGCVVETAEEERPTL